MKTLDDRIAHSVVRGFCHYVLQRLMVNAYEKAENDSALILLNITKRGQTSCKTRMILL